MDYNPGKELLNTFNKLGIDLGNCDPTVIEAWFDTDCLQIKEFLTWLTGNITQENVIHPHELEEYENYKMGKLIPLPDQYQTALDNVSEKYPGIFDVDENEFEIQYSKDELNLLLADDSKLDEILQVHESLLGKEKITLAQLEKQKIGSVIELEKAEEKCLQMSCNLDEVNKKLFDQIGKCSEKLVEYEYPSSTTYISNIPLNEYNNQYRNIISYFGLLERKEFSGLPKLQSAVKTCSKLDCSIFHNKTDDTLYKLKQKLFNSIQKKNYKEAIRDQLQAELKCLDRFNIYELMNSSRSKQQLEMNIQKKSDHFDILSLELEHLAAGISEKYANLPLINITKQEVKMLEGKLNCIKEVEDIFTKIFSYHTLLYFMLMLNNDDISKLDEFFRTVHHYIANNLTKCELRLESMNDIIKQNKLYEKIPLKQSSTLIQALLRLLLADSADDKADIDFLINFRNECCSRCLEARQFRQQIQPIENNNRVLRSFLTNGPTSEFVTFPFRLYELFGTVDNILNGQNNAVSTCIAVWKDAVKRMSENEWFKFKKQLWMYFLIQPQKILTNIQKIESELNKIRN